MAVEVWIVEAVDAQGRTLWRETFAAEARAETCYQAALKQGLCVHRWRL